MDAVGIRRRIPTLRSLVLVTFACAAGACSSKRTTPAPEPTRAEAEPTAVAASGGVSDGEVARVERAIRRYAADRAGRLPVKLDDLTRELSPEGDRYLVRLPLDPWGRPYAYAVVSARLGAYDLRSYGPDNLPGTADDVVADAQPVPVH